MRRSRQPEGQGLLFFPEPSPAPVWKPVAPDSPADDSDSSDSAAREQALDITQSWIVQAPAGSGKTELLTQRFLALLAHVDEPEEILAITFTRAATAEMRQRVLSALEAASALGGVAPQGEPPRSLALARAALAQSERRGWQLLEQPHRLDVQTIDSLCMRLAHGQPLLARLGGRLEPTEQAEALYEEAARRTLGRLGSAPPALEAALRNLLLLRDNNLNTCRSLLAELLKRRELWRHTFPLGAQVDLDWAQLRAELEAPFAVEVRLILSELHGALNADPAIVDGLLELAHYACRNGSKSRIGLLDGLQTLPGSHPDFLEHWECVRNFLLDTKDEWRANITKVQGFPSDGVAAPKAEQQQIRQRMTYLIGDLKRDPAAGERLRSLLVRVPKLPAPRYDDTQWQTLTSVFQVLRQAVAELHVLFAERNQVDFTELSIAAATLLDQADGAHGLLASESRRHLLVDEFQDTSRAQHRLIGRLLREWQPGDGRTCFLVGDPTQSIYSFREAEVELFGRVQRRGLDCGEHAHPCSSLTLSRNFRSHQGLVEPLNGIFSAIFAGEDSDEAEPAAIGPETKRAEVLFSPSTASAPVLPTESVHVHAFAALSGDAESRDAARRAEVKRIVALVDEELPRIARAQAEGEPGYSVAILGRAKPHLAPIAAALRARGIPFRAVELEALADRQEILDLVSLLRALLHPADRIAWLSVLRAPWCGLTLADLHTLTGGDDRLFRHRLLRELIAERAELLSDDGQERLARVVGVLDRAHEERFRRGHAHSLVAWLERAWTSLGAPAYLTAAERENIEAFFNLLDTLPPNGTFALDGTLEKALRQLCAAPDATVSERFGIQLMTIHKAKGLGFEVVIVPSLERKVGSDRLPLIIMLERAHRLPGEEGAEQSSADDMDEVLVAPMGREGEKHRTYGWVQEQRHLRERGERKRLFYVACTRARRTLHLLGVSTRSKEGRLLPGDAGSLLACAWPALAARFAEQLTAPAQDLIEAATPAPVLLETIAAAAASADQTLRVVRVPTGFTAQVAGRNVTATSTFKTEAVALPQPRLERPEGSFERRARGTAIHAMMELAGRWLGATNESVETGDASLRLRSRLERTARGALRQAGLARARTEAMLPALVSVVEAAASHAEGRWILGPHPDARTEWSLTVQSAEDERPITLRVDRAFRAGPTPLAPGEDTLWIIDYKTGTDPGSVNVEAYLNAQREQWRPQLDNYGAAVRALGDAPQAIRCGLYFPELLRLIDWPHEG